jgi:nitroreductase
MSAGSDPDSVPFFDVVQNRRSVRKFTAAAVPEKHVAQMLDAARLAPTAGNQQPWRFLVVRDREKMEQVRQECIADSIEAYKERESPAPGEVEAHREKVSAYYRDFLSAPLYILVLVDTESKYPSYNVHDGPLAAGQLILAARALGYGTVFTTDSVSEAITRKVFNIPEHLKRVCILPIGIPEEWPGMPTKKAIDELVVYETF